MVLALVVVAILVVLIEVFWKKKSEALFKYRSLRFRSNFQSLADKQNPDGHLLTDVYANLLCSDHLQGVGWLVGWLRCRMHTGRV